MPPRWTRPPRRWGPFAPGTAREIVIGGMLCASGLLAAFAWPGPLSQALAVLASASWAGLLFFLRDPDRAVSAQGHEILSPADGRVIAVRRTDQPLFLGGPALQVSVFLGVLDVHVNRAPAAGRVALVQHRPGRFLQAFREEAPQVNEQNWIGIQADGRRILTRQVAGILARRIECWVETGDAVRAGDRIGMIKLGSRVDVFVPEPAAPRVREGDRVRAGVTVVAETGRGTAS